MIANQSSPCRRASEPPVSLGAPSTTSAKVGWAIVFAKDTPQTSRRSPAHHTPKAKRPGLSLAKSNWIPHRHPLTPNSSQPRDLQSREAPGHLKKLPYYITLVATFGDRLGGPASVRDHSRSRSARLRRSRSIYAHMARAGLHSVRAGLDLGASKDVRLPGPPSTRGMRRRRSRESRSSPSRPVASSSGSAREKIEPVRSVYRPNSTKANLLKVFAPPEGGTRPSMLFAPWRRDGLSRARPPPEGRCGAVGLQFPGPPQHPHPAPYLTAADIPDSRQVSGLVLFLLGSCCGGGSRAPTISRRQTRPTPRLAELFPRLVVAALPVPRPGAALRQCHRPCQSGN